MKTQGKNTWDLTLLYKNGGDPHIEKDSRELERAYARIEKKYKGKDFTSSAPKLVALLEELGVLDKKLKGSKPMWYFSLRTSINADDKEAGAKANLYSQRFTAARNKIVFILLALGKIPVPLQKKYLKDPLLADYRYFLKKTFDRSKYLLTEQEEQLAGLLTQPAYRMWVNSQSKVLSRKIVNFKGKELPLAEAISIVASQPKKDRHSLHTEINKVYKDNSDFAASEINAAYTFKKIMDERRGYAEPYSATVLDYENDEKTVRNLVDTVTKGFKISHRFYALQAKLLKEKKITLPDRGVAIGRVQKKFDFPYSLEIVSRAFDKVDPKYGKILHMFVENRQIDVYPRKGKKGGAFCWGNDYFPTFVMLNHTDDIRSVETLAHEMGHAFHNEMSKSQPSHYRDYTTATAEVASTFFEQVAQSELEHELDSKAYAILLHNKIMGDISTIFRQVAFYNFELELHTRLRKEGELSKEDLAKLMNKHLKSYLGPAVEVAEDDGYFFTYISHIRRFFYVYSYAYGQLISRALFEKWKEDKSYAKKIEQFLKAGGSMSPEDIFKSIGIDTSDPAFFATGLKAIEKDIAKLEKLTSSTRKKSVVG